MGAAPDVANLVMILMSWTADNWAAAASVATLLVALAAAGLSIIPISQAAKLRKEQAQPYVVAYMEQSVARNQIIDLVVRNYGTTLARDVTLSLDPPMILG
jgi:hypothetical protein